MNCHIFILRRKHRTSPFPFRRSSDPIDDSSWPPPLSFPHCPTDRGASKCPALPNCSLAHFHCIHFNFRVLSSHGAFVRNGETATNNWLTELLLRILTNCSTVAFSLKSHFLIIKYPNVVGFQGYQVLRARSDKLRTRLPFEPFHSTFLISFENRLFLLLCYFLNLVTY